jgi:hypothetical protein
MKLITLILILSIFGALVIGNLTHGFKQLTPNSSSPVPAQSQVLIQENKMQPTVSADVPPDWKKYTSPNGFILHYPADIQYDIMPEGERFFKPGPTQSLGTELYDGISILIRTGDMANMTLQELVGQKYQQIKEEETTREITDPVSVIYGNNQAIQFRQIGFGDGDFIYLQMPGKKYLEIINMTVEPQNRKQSYQKIVEQMIGSINF